MVHTSFAYDLAMMMSHWTYKNASNNDNIMLYTSQGTLIVNQRQDLVTQALKDGCTHILFLDSDMRIPKDTLCRLLAHDNPIVAGSYATRRLPCKTVAFQNDQNWDCVYTTPDKTGLESVASVGMGCMLVNLSIFDKMTLPWFMIGYSPAANQFTGEDIFFCRKARASGFEVLIDHDLSRELGHIGNLEFRHEHANLNIEEANNGNSDIQRP
jgi:hypothetical protein